MRFGIFDLCLIVEKLPDRPAAALPQLGQNAGMTGISGVVGEVGLGPAHLFAIRKQVPEDLADPDNEWLRDRAGPGLSVDDR